MEYFTKTSLGPGRATRVSQVQLLTLTRNGKLGIASKTWPVGSLGRNPERSYRFAGLLLITYHSKIWAMIYRVYNTLEFLLFLLLPATSYIYIHKNSVQKNPSSKLSSHHRLFPSYHITPTTFKHISSPNPLTWFQLLTEFSLPEHF